MWLEHASASGWEGRAYVGHLIDFCFLTHWNLIDTISWGWGYLHPEEEHALRVFDQESHSVTRWGRGITRAGEAYSIGENLSLSITKQDRACKYVSLRWQINVFYQNTPDITMEYRTPVYSANQREPEWETV
jgi:hypothetical protein